MRERRRVAVVLFNLGGPDRPEDVRPFLRNLFRDPAIVSAPGPVREAVALLISATREKLARENYALMGGGSPLLAETRKQAAALESALAAAHPDVEWRAFIGMRYWSPYVADAAAEVRAWTPDDTVLLPLYPQFSTTTTGSSLTAWRKAAPDLPARAVHAYPDAPGFVRAHAAAIERIWRAAGSPADARVLFSAHGLPRRTVERGDPYQDQVERTAAAVAALLPPGLEDRVICYQSRVGPLEWIGPETIDELRRAGADRRTALVCPIAFVSEHVETLVELDEIYAKAAREAGVAGYLRVPALGADETFIGALRDLVTEALAEPGGAEGALGTNLDGALRPMRRRG